MNYCPYLWKSQCILANSKVIPCCHSSTNKTWNEINFEDGIRTSHHQEARDLMQNNKWPEVCTVCKNNEANNLPSPRLRAIQIFGEQNKEVTLEYLDIKFSNKCNLSCRMCNPLSSSSLEKLYKKSKKDDMPEFLQLYHNKDMSESYDAELKKAEYTKKAIKEGLKHLKITGGEPFASVPFLNVVNWAIENNYTQNLGLSLTTNGTKYNKKLLEKLYKFNYLSIVVSVDGTGDIYNYIRQGTDWNRLQDNLNLFDNFFYDKKDKFRYYNNTIHIAVVLQFYNIFDIPNILEWCIKRGYRPKIDVNLKPNNSELSIKFLPDDFKYEIIKYLEFYLENFESNDWALSQLNLVLDFVKSTIGKGSNEKNKQLKHSIIKQDKIYKTDYRNFLHQKQIQFLNGITL
jgi:MoaA/NifB/PqqE/SkfB family radical SAM enzyme